jgi:hypothetical protein
VVLAAAVAALGAAAPAWAGTFAVHACESGGVKGNRSWNSVGAQGIVADEECDSGSVIGHSVAGGTNPIPEGAAATTTFSAAPGTTIADFTLSRQLTYRNPTASNTHRLYAIFKLGGTVFAGAGNYDDAVRNRLNAQRSWYGYPNDDVTLPRATVTRAAFPALAGYRGDATTLQISVGCFRRGTPCSVGSGGSVRHVLHGAAVVLNDPRLPTADVEAAGLLAGGRRHGSDPVTFDATDNTGIKRAEIVDVTDGGSSVVGTRSFPCDYRVTRPCPLNPSNQTIAPTSLSAGHRTLKVRIVDAAENAAERGPFVVDVATPSDRGPLNGIGATEDGRLTARFIGTRATRRTVSYNARVRIIGRLRNSAGRPVSGAQLRLISRDRRPGARFVERGSVTTGPDGIYRATVRASASRLLQVGWRSHVNDPGFEESAYLTLKARASARLSAAPRVVGLGRTLRLSGRVRGAIPRRGVALIFQGRGRGGRYTTFADGRSSRRGTFRARYRFRSGASRGHTFVFRVKLRRDTAFPYEQGYSNPVRVRVR